MSSSWSLESPAAAKPGFAYSDIQSLKRIDTAGEDGIKAAAQQFESLFIGMMLKGMRDANAVFAEDNPLSSPEMTMHQEMLDQQWAIHMAESGGMGLAPIIEAQLRGERRPAEPGGSTPLLGEHPEKTPPLWERPPGREFLDSQAIRGRASEARVSELRSDAAAPTGDAKPQAQKRPAFADRQDFITRLLPEIEQVVQGAGLSATAVLAQSALETGWGQKIIHGPDGRSSHNLFGIKAGRGWDGERVTVNTMEVVDGLPRMERAEFRSYPDVRTAIEDYVRLLESDDRYREVLNAEDHVGFTEALQRSGYATDPRYAQKIRAVLGSLNGLLGS
ncbi:MAG: flagellar assembly peptidoglycan hydrolase FlgJ [Gammaproteobacteria bacterium]|jgi:flagellar protein FlgJ|nr:flagellar assembly peptidoglycan hydrolase FlgJ [Gammaproteobacteria bacterium]